MNTFLETFGLRRGSVQTTILAALLVTAVTLVAACGLQNVATLGIPKTPTPTPAGIITEFPLPTAGSFPAGITTGPDGNLWFTEGGPSTNGTIGRITTKGQLTGFPLPTPNSHVADITAGPDKNLWFTGSDATDNGFLGRITPTGDERTLEMSREVPHERSDA